MFEAEHCSLRLFIAKDIAKKIFRRYAKIERGLLLIYQNSEHYSVATHASKPSAKPSAHL